MRSLKKILQFTPVTIIIVSGLCFLVILLLRSSGSLESLELTAYDWSIRLRPKSLHPVPRIVVIHITEQDIHTLGRWPLTDAVLSQILKNILMHEPCAIGVDIFRDIPIPPGSEELTELLDSHSNIICVTKFGNGGVAPPPILENTAQVGFNDILVDPGGIVRRGLLFLDDSKEIYYSFNLLLALHFLQQHGISAQPDEQHPEYLKLGGTTIKPLGKNQGGYIDSDDRGYQFLIDFMDPFDFHQSYSLSRLLSGQINPLDFQDKIVLIGVSAQSVKDLFYTPLSRGIRAEQQMPGVVLHARLTSQLIRFGLNESRPLKTAGKKQASAFIWVWGLAGSLTGFFIRSPWRFSLVICSGLVFLWMLSYAAFLNQWWVPLVPPALAWLSSAGLSTAYVSNREKKHKSVLMQLFSKHVSREIADAIWDQREQFLNNGRPVPQKMTVTILFSDIKGFTTISEILDPQSLIEWLNTYMGAMTETIMAHGGVVDDYAGDGIKANFGVPFPRKTRAAIAQDAVNAVTCAIAMGQKVAELNATLETQKLPTVGTRIGIFTGPIVAGALGSSQRMKYTTVGDAVNTAARLESYDKNLAGDTPWRILIGEPTLQYLNNQFNVQMIGKTDLKGKNETINIYRVFSSKDNPVNRG